MKGHSHGPKKSCGPGGIRTPDLFSAIEARSQLRYRPQNKVAGIVPDRTIAVKECSFLALSGLPLRLQDPVLHQIFISTPFAHVLAQAAFIQHAILLHYSS
jgi:hypothetical protein